MITKEDLIREYGAMQSRIDAEIKALREEKKEWLKREINRTRQEHKTAFAIRLNAARDEGMKREDLLSVLNTQRGDVLKEYVEMGGGKMRKNRTADERIAEIREANEAEKQELFARLGVIEEFVSDRGFPAFRLEEDFWGYVDRGKFWPGNGDDFDITKWQPFIKSDRRKIGEELVEYVENREA